MNPLIKKLTDLGHRQAKLTFHDQRDALIMKDIFTHALTLAYNGALEEAQKKLKRIVARNKSCDVISVLESVKLTK